MPRLKNLFLRVYWSRGLLPAERDYGQLLFDVNSIFNATNSPRLSMLALWVVARTDYAAALEVMAAMPTWPRLALPQSVEVLDLHPHFMLQSAVDTVAPGPRWLFLYPGTALRELRLSAVDFSICAPDNWRNQLYLRRVRIDGRVYLSDAPMHCPRVAIALSDAVPWWRTTLCVLQLFDIRLDFQLADALGQLSALHQLDIHPSELDSSVVDQLLDVENDNLLKAQHLLLMAEQNAIFRPPDSVLQSMSLAAAMPVYSTHCIVTRVPIELWLDIFDKIPSRIRQRTYQVLAGVCTHLRQLVLGRAFASLRMSAGRAHLLQNFVTDLSNLGVPHVFRDTLRIQILCALSELNAVLEMPRLTFTRLSEINIVVRPVDFALQDVDRNSLSPTLGQIALLKSLPHLRDFSLYIFTYVGHHRCGYADMDIATLAGVYELNSLHRLALRIGGATDLYARRNFPLPPRLRRLRVSPQVLAFIARSSWRECADLSFVEIEDERSTSHLRRRTAEDSAAHLSTSLASAMPAWSTRLHVLRLLDTCSDYAGLIWLSQLHALTRLDFHPSSVELSDLEIPRLVAAATLAAGSATFRGHRRVPSVERIDLSGLGPFAGPVKFPYTLVYIVHIIKFLLSHLRQLRVIHVGSGKSWHNSQMTPARYQAQHVRFFDELVNYIPPSLCLWHFGAAGREDDRLYLHLPTCSLCESLPPGRRSQECLVFEESLRAQHVDDAITFPSRSDIEMEMESWRIYPELNV
ncbi:hypothetical protein AURDEDRAFT_163272 [Auricularia subglabra TFB-10046 SS5]|nr:hypothetical protein AURDEDRAFT_163272 [Auricularia subglabra TFB-10046 SS5]